MRLSSQISILFCLILLGFGGVMWSENIYTSNHPEKVITRTITYTEPVSIDYTEPIGGVNFISKILIISSVASIVFVLLRYIFQISFYYNRGHNRID